jgi:hypothetical protein
MERMINSLFGWVPLSTTKQFVRHEVLAASHGGVAAKRTAAVAAWFTLAWRGHRSVTAAQLDSAGSRCAARSSISDCHHKDGLLFRST